MVTENSFPFFYCMTTREWLGKMKIGFHEDVYKRPWSLSHDFCTHIPNIWGSSDKMCLALKGLTGHFFLFSDFQIVIANGDFPMDTNVFIMLTYRKILDEKIQGVTNEGAALRCSKGYQRLKVAIAVCQDHYYESSKTVTRVIGILLGIYDDRDEHKRVDSQGKICGDDFISETGKRDHFSDCSREVFKDKMERAKPSCIPERAKCYRSLFMVTTPEVYYRNCTVFRRMMLGLVCRYNEVFKTQCEHKCIRL